MNHFYSVLKSGTRYLVLGTILLLLAACAPAADQTLPTAVDINMISTNDAATRDAQATGVANATATRNAQATLNAPATLPPTWTAAPPPTEPPSQSNTVSSGGNTAATGTIYYIFNGD